MNVATAEAPSKLYLMMEGRALLEFGASIAARRWLRAQPKGDGHSVLVLPGLGASDTSTAPLRAYLERQGYDAHAWGLGRNLGIRGRLLEDLLQRLEEVHAQSGGKVSLVGWSLGGIFAREIAKMRPELIRQVITLGSPFGGNPRASHAWRIYEMFADHDVDNPPIDTQLAEAPPVPTTSIYSRTDGIVAWECCHNIEGDMIDNIEVEGSHCGLGVNPVVMAAIADRLALGEDEWAPFDRTSGWRQMLYKDPLRDGEIRAH